MVLRSLKLIGSVQPLPSSKTFISWTQRERMMKMTVIFQNFRWVRWALTGLMVYSFLSFFVSEAAAQDPTPLPTPTPAPTWTPPPNATNTPAPNVPVQPTPVLPTATLDNRLVDFRVDNDEIDQGDCVQFSWAVRGNIDRIEFDEVDDNKEAVLVSAQDEREECPDQDTEYELSVQWLDGTKSAKTLEIQVNNSSDGSSSSSSGSSAGQSSETTVGSFVPVTPIALTSLTPTAEANAETSDESALFQQITQEETAGQPVEKPSGVLGSVDRLPETGGALLRKDLSPADRPSVTGETSYQSPTERSELIRGLVLIGRWGLLIGVSVILLKLLIDTGRCPPPTLPRN